MFKIALCDKDPSACLELHRIIATHPRAQEMTVTEYRSGEKLCTILSREEVYDLIILNVALPGWDGIQVGDYLRRTLHDSVTQILFVSERPDYSMQLFDIRPLNFLLKPVKAEKLLECLDQAMLLREEGSECHTFTANKTVYRVPVREIRYFESYNKQVTVHTVKGIYSYYGKLREIEHLSDFIKIHQSYLVNYYFIRRASYESLELDDGTKLHISQPYRKSVRELLLTRFPKK